MIRNKKGFELSFNVIIVATILLITLVIILVFATGGFKKLFGGIDDKIDGTADPDKDGVTNIFDRCPCTSEGASPSKDYNGCPDTITAEQLTQEKEKKCS